MSYFLICKWGKESLCRRAPHIPNVLGQQGSGHTHFEDAGWAQKYRYNRRLSLQQPCSVAGGSGVGLARQIFPFAPDPDKV